jgi:hypothetical protein
VEGVHVVEKAIKIRSDDFGALYKILVSARRQGNPGLQPWELPFEEELYRGLARRLAKRERQS